MSWYLPLKTQSGCHNLCKTSLHFIIIKRTSFYILVHFISPSVVVIIFPLTMFCLSWHPVHSGYCLAHSRCSQVDFWTNDWMRCGMEWAKITKLESQIYIVCVWDLVGDVVENRLQKLIVKVNQFVLVVKPCYKFTILWIWLNKMWNI